MTGMHQKTYVLDANVFIQGHRHYYAMAISPGFWSALSHHHSTGFLLSVDRVKQELLEGKDALATWISRAPTGMFAGTADPAVVEAFSKMMEWVQANPNYNEDAKAEFAEVADGWLIAFAKVHGHVVVTHEVYDPHIKKKVPIPNVCKEFGVPYMNTFGMLKELAVQLRWP